MQTENTIDSFWPRNISLREIWINTLWAFISGIVWSLIMFFIVFLISWYIDIPDAFDKTRAGLWTNSIFPFMLSLIAFFGSSIAIFSTYFFLTKTDPNKYKSTTIHYWQLAFFMILTYIFITPLYVYTWLQTYDNIMYIFMWHVMILFFWTYIISELLNNYKYVLTWIYWSFVWLFLTFFISASLFVSFSSWFAKLMVLLVLLPIINSLILLFKQLFELAYYKYYTITWYDQLGDIFYQLEEEEREQQKEAEALNN